MRLRAILLWLVIILTCAVYIGTGALVLWLPCQDELLIGFCALGKVLVLGLGALLLAGYLFLVFFTERSRALQQAPSGDGTGVARIMLFSLAFIIIPIVFAFGALRSNPGQQPYALPRIRQNGREGVAFISFSEAFVEPAQMGDRFGLVASGQLRVQKSGDYTIFPMRPKGELPVKVMTPDRERLAPAESQYLQAGETYQFDYFFEIQPSEKGAICDQAHWNILWSIESLPPFPLYLFGQGIFAQVYPQDSGEFAFVTHINPEYETGNYNVCVDEE